MLPFSRLTSWSRRYPGYSRVCNASRRQARKQRRGSKRNSKCAGSTSADWRANWNGRGIMMTWSAKLACWGQLTSRRYQPANLERAWSIFLWSASRRFSKPRIWNPPTHPTHSVSEPTMYLNQDHYITEIGEAFDFRREFERMSKMRSFAKFD